MKSTGAGAAGKLGLGNIARKPIGTTETAWLRTRLLHDDRGPLLMSPALDGVDPVSWASRNRDFIESNLLKHGALLWRGFGPGGALEFEQFVKAVSGELLDYHERSSPRHQVHGRIYTSTDYPPRQSIFFHNENSYQYVWPMKIFFMCQTPAEEGGETPIADTRGVLRLISSAIVERFAQKGCMYVRNFSDELGLSWQSVFQTEDKAAVESYCHRVGINFEWLGGNRLRTRAVRPAVLTHPRTQERIWFNHVAFFHVSTLDASVAAGLRLTMAEDELPNNTYYGDGSRIEPTVLDEIRDAYQRASVSFTWEPGDILLLDNMLMAHSRTRYAGARKVLVGMTEPFSSAKREGHANDRC
jgi:alpha-ketoglutarate-dependent taurine dioxygenase